MIAEKLWTKDQVRSYINHSDKWLIRGILAIYKFQTEDEKNTEATLHQNEIGFNGVDAFILSEFAKQYTQKGFLSPKQKTIARKKMLKYSGQLAKIANNQI